MHTLLAVTVLCAGVLGLGACDQTQGRPAAPAVEPEKAEAGAAAGPPGSTTVPPAEGVFAPAMAASAAVVTGRSNTAMSAAQESTAMPMPGQNNDHSAPLGPAKRASAP